MVTARGRPSGTATTMMVTPKMKKSRILFGSSLLKPWFWTSHLPPCSSTYQLMQAHCYKAAEQLRTHQGSNR